MLLLHLHPLFYHPICVICVITLSASLVSLLNPCHLCHYPIHVTFLESLVLLHDLYYPICIPCVLIQSVTCGITQSASFVSLLNPHHLCRYRIWVPCGIKFCVITPSSSVVSLSNNLCHLSSSSLFLFFNITRSVPTVPLPELCHVCHYRIWVPCVITQSVSFPQRFLFLCGSLTFFRFWPDVASKIGFAFSASLQVCISDISEIPLDVYSMSFPKKAECPHRVICSHTRILNDVPMSCRARTCPCELVRVRLSVKV